MFNLIAQPHAPSCQFFLLPEEEANVITKEDDDDDQEMSFQSVQSVRASEAG